MIPRVIGLTGHMGAGKDTVAAMLPGYRRLGFADQVKRLALAIDPMIGGHPESVIGSAIGQMPLSQIVDMVGWDAAKADVEVRQFLQRLGHGARQIVGERVWIDALAAQVIATTDPVVIADVRYPNEATEIRRWGGVVWKVARPGYDGNAHPSEWGVDEVVPDAVIHNNGSTDDLHRVVARLTVGVVA